MFIEFRNYTTCIQSNNLDSIELAITRIFELEGCRRISQPPQTLSNEELRQTPWLLLPDLWIVGLFVSTPGWTIVKTEPNELLCRRARGAARPRLSELAMQIGCNAFHFDGTLADVSSPPIFPTSPVKPTPSGSPWIIIPFIFYKILDAGPAGSPIHADEINPITVKGYKSVKEYELIKQLTPEQESEIRRLTSIPSIGLTFDYVQEKGRFSQVELDNNHKCYGIPLIRHLGGDKYHDQYATDVTGSKGDFIVIPPAAISGSKSAIYDGIVLSDSASGSPPKATRIQPPQKVGDLAEVKTGYEALARIVEGNPLPQNEVNGRTIPSDQERYDQLVKQVLKPVLGISNHTCG